MTTDRLPVYQLPASRPAPCWDPAEGVVLHTAAEHLQRCFTELLASDALLTEYVLNMKAIGLHAVVFGGWARDRLFELIYQDACPSRDIDMVALGATSIERALPTTAVRNLFGGVGIAASTVHFDGWNLPNTFLISRNRLPVSFDQLPFTADYNINAVLFGPAELIGHTQVLDAGAIGALRSRTLDFAADEVALPLVQAARSVILASRLRLNLSATVKDFLRAVCGTTSARSEVALGIQQHCPPEWKEVAVSLFRSV